MKNIATNNSKQTQRGITLIALVITIIVLLILAGVTINLVFGENGIFEHAQNAKEAYKIGEITEKLQLAKVPVQLDNRGMTVLDKYIDEIIKEGIITEGDIEETGDENSRYITVEGEYVYLIEEKNKDIEITYQGKLGNLIPNLLIEVVDIQSTSIRIKANGTRMEKGEYTYYIKNITKKEEYELKETRESNEYTFNGLEPDNQYQIKVDAKNANGTATKETQIITTVKQKVTGIKLNKETTELTIGRKETLTATIEPENASNKEVKWSSTNEEIVSVDNGEITGVSSGTAKITAEAVDGSGVKAICTVTVIQQGTVTYNIDTGNTQTQIYNYGEDALKTSFTPTKSGYTFVGWKEDKAANASVLTAKEVNQDTINLYAVFKQTITLTYNGNGATGGSTASQSGTQYYNNGTIANPSFSLRTSGFTKTNYTFQNWAMGSASGTKYNAGASVTLSANTTFYATWKANYVSVTSASISGNVTLTRNDGANVWPYSPCTDGRSHMSGYTRTSLPSNGCISWNGDYFNIKANCPCTVTITGSLSLYGVDRGAQHLCQLYLGGSVNRTLFDHYISRLTGGTGTINTTITLSTGQYIRIICSGGNDNDTRSARAQFNGTLYITATPNI